MTIKAKKLNRIVIKEEIFALTKDTFEAIILGQLIYWEEKVRDFDQFLLEEIEKRKNQEEEDVNIELKNGWIYKTAKQLIEECMLTISEVTMRRYLQNLIDKRFIECRKNPLNKWDRKLQYRVNISFIISEIKKIGYDGLSGYNLLNLQNKASNLQNEESLIQNEGAIADNNNRDYKTKTINKETTKVAKKDSAWRTDFNVYKSACEEAGKILAEDEGYKNVLLSSYPNADYYRTIKKSLAFWESEKGWGYKKRTKSRDINMVTTLKNNLEKNVVYKNTNDVPIENETKLKLRVIDANGTLEDGTIFRNGYRYCESSDGREYSIPVDEVARPDERWEYDFKKGWYLPEQKETLDDLLW